MVSGSPVSLRRFSPLQACENRRVCQLRALGDQIQRGSSNIIDRMPRKIALSPVRNLPSPHFPSTVLFQPVVICYALGSPDFPLSSPPSSLIPLQRAVWFSVFASFHRLFSAINGLHLPVGLPPWIWGQYYWRYFHLSASLLLTPTRHHHFLEWASKAAKSRRLTQLPCVGSIPMRKFAVPSF